jgi:hypothetical protein
MLPPVPRIDFDVVHTPEVTLVRIYYRDRRNVLVPLHEVQLSVGSDFPQLYDSFRKEYKWPTVEELELDVLKRYKGSAVDRSGLSDAERSELAGRDLAEFFKAWLLIKGRGTILA